MTYQTRYNAREIQYASVKDIQNSCDVFDYQSHTYNFHKRTGDKNAYLETKSTEEITTDLLQSSANLKKETYMFAYPYDQYNSHTISVLSTLPITLAFTTDNRFTTNNTDILEVPRITILPQDSLQRFIQKLHIN